MTTPLETRSVEPHHPESPETPPRGVSPRILLTQILNTLPFLNDPSFVARTPSEDPRFAYLRTLRETHAWLEAHPGAEPELSHSEYFRLCLSAHWATVGTFVPTDVDNQIRFRLWHPAVPLDELRKMAEAVLECHGWDFRPVGTRFVVGPQSVEILGGIHGEWFSVACGAYGCFRKKDPEMAATLGGAIVREAQREADLFLEFWRKKDGVNLLKCATAIAHNLGDLDRVIGDAWNVPADDPVMIAVYKAGHEGQERFGGALFAAGELNKYMMADENHRHFALRKSRAIRRHSDLLLPIAPFLDDWGRIVGRHPALSAEEVAEVVEALMDGWARMPKTVGYPRAIAGILDSFPGGLSRMGDYLPARNARTLKAGDLRALCSTPRNRFEDQWSTRAIAFLKRFALR